MVIRSSTPPTVEVDSDALAAYVRFRRTKVARTVTRPSRTCHVAVDLDRSGEVVGIEIIGARVIQIGKILEQAAVRAPQVDFSKVRYIPAGMAAQSA